MKLIATALTAFMVANLSLSASAAPPSDPLESPMWADMARKYLAGGEIRFDDRVKVVVPGIVEDQAQVPVTADARGVDGVVKLIVFADLNPIQHVLTLTPLAAAPYVSFRMKVEQGTPVRAAALTGDGVWHVGGVLLEAAGGGCSAPAMARKDADWSATVGEAQGRLWREADGLVRARLRMRHPMDTGLAKDNTPAYFIETLEMRGGSGELLAKLEMFEPMSEDPTLTLLLQLPQSDSAVELDARDNNGASYKATLPALWRQSKLGSSTGRNDASTP